MVVIDTPAAMVTGKFWLVLEPAESTTVTPIVYAPLAVGEPVIDPALETLRPAGTPVADQVYGGTPPVAARMAAYDTPMLPFGSDAVVMLSDGAVTVTEKVLLAVEFALSLTVMVKVKVPAAVRFPASVPPPKLVPAGSVPLAPKV